ncbi:MAG TPA: chemotaxis protein CheX [Candidatus Sulfopaludibacter sp.]|jgi:CheY-specific phosphatase CheX|nr:chemotaxis protein CheX [Candidatus Sulfopaludibacter sp.]
MTENLQALLQQSIEEVLEKMFFIRSLAALGDNTVESQDGVMVRLAFGGEAAGSLRMRVTAAMARSISADFLGLEESELTGNQVGEVICELANMICGSFLSRVACTAAFRIGAPQLIEDIEFSNPASQESGSAASHSVDTGEGSLTVWVNTEIPECSSAKRHAS